MSAPVFTMEVGFASDPGTALASTTWTNVSQWVTGWHSHRGRQRELDSIEGATLDVTFLNSDRRFDPTHTGSPYNPNVLPMRRIRISAVHNAVTYRLMTGYVDSWPQAWEGPNVGFSTVTAIDGFLPLAKTDVGEGTVWPEEFTGARITRALDLAGWPAADRALDTGQSKLASVEIPLGSGTTALDACKAAAEAELGVFFLDGQGRAVFHDRHHRKATGYLAAAATFGDANTSGLPYQTVTLEPDADRIWNDIQVSPASGIAAQSEDATSQTQYLRRTLTRSIPLSRDTEAVDQAAYLLSIYKQPKYRLTDIQVTPTTDPLWVQALAREIGDHVTVKRWPQRVGSVVTQECSVEAIDHQWRPGATAGGVLTTRWLLSTPAPSAVDWWILNDATFGVEGTTTKLVY